MALLVVSAEPTRGQSDDRVGLVIRHGNGDVTTQCVAIDDSTTSGFDVLLASGIDLSFEAQSVGTAICSLAGEGCSFPRESCFCQCTSSPCMYWSYWLLEDGAWTYANQGAGNRSVTPGSVEGWSWGSGTMGVAADTEPPQVSYAEICEPERVATETAAMAATAAAQATSAAAAVTPTATISPTPRPSNTPIASTGTPAAPPLITYLAPDRERIHAGESIVLTWETINADDIVLITDGREQAQAAAGTLTLTPAATTTYWLEARNAAGTDRVDVTIVVDPAPTPVTEQPAGATPTDAAVTATSAVIADLAADATAMPTHTPIVVATLTPTPMSSPTPTLTPIVVGQAVATLPPMPMDAPTATSTPIVVPTLTPTPLSVAAEAVDRITATVSASSTMTSTTVNGESPGSVATATDAPKAAEDTASAAANMPGAVALNSQADAAAADSVQVINAEQVQAADANTAVGTALISLLVIGGAPLLLGGLALIFLRMRKRDPA